MGAALSVSDASNIQTAVNQTYQSAKNTCTADCNQTISGNVIVLDNSKAGNITFTQKCTADASCYMNNAIEQAVTTFQGANVAADASPALFPGIQVNVSKSSNQQDIKNALTQVLENICQSTVNQAATNNIVYATDSTLGNIGFVQDGNAKADCIMENTARMTLQMKQQGDATAKAGGGISIGAGIVGLIILVVIIIVVAGALKRNSSGGGGGGGNFGGPQQGQGGGGFQNFGAQSFMGQQQFQQQGYGSGGTTSTGTQRTSTTTRTSTARSSGGARRR